MATEWKRIALAEDLKQRTLHFQLHGYAGKGVASDGVNFLGGGYQAQEHGSFPRILWSADEDEGTDAGCIGSFNLGEATTGDDVNTAYFTLSGSLSDQATTEQDHSLESVWGGAMVVPNGNSVVAKHTFDVSGLISNDSTSAASSTGVKLWFNLWRAYMPSSYKFGTNEPNDGVTFRLVKNQLSEYNSVSDYDSIVAPDEPESMVHFVTNTIEVPLDPDECLPGQVSYYLLGVWASVTSPAAYPGSAVYWPNDGNNEPCSFKVQVEATYAPHERHPFIP